MSDYLLKTSRPGKFFSHLVLQSYPEDKQLCVCEVLQAYLERKMRKTVGKHNNKCCGWANTSTFSKFYDKPIFSDTEENFGHALLKSIHVA